MIEQDTDATKCLNMCYEKKQLHLCSVLSACHISCLTKVQKMNIVADIS